MEGFLLEASIYLGAAILVVPLAMRLGLGSVLGYLAAGILVGPVFGIAGAETADLQHFAEFGVVLMLFLIGLELEPRTLWDMRHRLIGMGGAQVVLTTAAIALLAYTLGLAWQVALTLGLIMSLSSTAIVLQTLNEKALMRTAGGRASFSVLLTQDIAVIPMLAFLPLLTLPAILGPTADLYGISNSADEAVHGAENAAEPLLTLVEQLAGVDADTDGHEEEAQQQALERLDIGLDLVAELRVGQHDPGHKGAKRGRQANQHHQKGDAQHDQQRKEGRHFGQASSMDKAEHRARQEVSRQHDAAHYGEGQQGGGPARQLFDQRQQRFCRVLGPVDSLIGAV